MALKEFTIVGVDEARAVLGVIYAEDDGTTLSTEIPFPADMRDAALTAHIVRLYPGAVPEKAAAAIGAATRTRLAARLGKTVTLLAPP